MSIAEGIPLAFRQSGAQGPPAGNVVAEGLLRRPLPIRRDADGQNPPDAYLCPREVDRKVVQQAAVHEEVAVVPDRRQDPRNRGTRPNTVQQRSSIVHDELGLGQVHRGAEERVQEVFDLRIAEKLLEGR